MALELPKIYADTSVYGGVFDDEFKRPSMDFFDAIRKRNFKHIVHYNKIPLYNAVNTLKGYKEILIHSPLEVIEYGS